MSKKEKLHVSDDGVLRVCVAKRPDLCWYSEAHTSQPELAKAGGGTFHNGHEERTVSPLLTAGDQQGYVVKASNYRRLYNPEGDPIRGSKRASFFKALGQKLQALWAPPKRVRRKRAQADELRQDFAHIGQR